MHVKAKFSVLVAPWFLATPVACGGTAEGTGNEPAQETAGHDDHDEPEVTDPGLEEHEMTDLDPPDLVCTNAGPCSPMLLLSFGEQRLNVGDYSLVISAPEGTTTCQLSWESDAEPVIQSTCEGPVTVMPVNVGIYVEATPASLYVQLTNNVTEATVAETFETLEYEDFYPNGQGCPPDPCKQGTVELDLKDLGGGR